MNAPRKLGSGRWQARYYVKVGGQRVTRSAGTFASKLDAQDAINGELLKIRAGRWTDPMLSQMTVREWSQAWYAARKPTKKVRSFLDSRILPQWGDWRLADVQNLNVKAWVLALAVDLKPQSVMGVYSTFSMMMTDAMHADRIVKSPCWGPRRDGVPPVRRSRLNYLTADEGRRLVALAPAKYKALFHLALWTGMRWGELAALRWENVDLEAGVIHVREAVKREDGRIGLPKGDKARVVSIGASTVEVLRTHRRDYGTRDLLFTSPRGMRLRYEHFRIDVFLPLVEKLELDWDMTFHALRHTYCSTMLESGVDALVVAEQAGHSDASLTLRIYGHARHDSGDVAREAIERMMER